MTSGQPQVRQVTSWKTLVVLLGVITVGGIALRAWQLTARSLWFDEAFCWRLTQFPLDEMIRRVALDNHPPLYFLLLRWWSDVFGDSVLALRGLSVLLGGATILGVYLFCVEAFGGAGGRVQESKGGTVEEYKGRRVQELKGGTGDAGGTAALHLSRAQQTGLLAAALVAVSVLQIRWAWEVRMYVLGTALLAFSSWALFRALHGPRPASWILYAVITLAMAYTHYYLLFSIVAQFLLLQGWLLVRHRAKPAAVARDPVFRGAVLAGAVIAAGFSVWLPALLEQRAQVQENFWTREIDRWRVAIVGYQMFVEPLDPRYNKMYFAVAAALTGSVGLALLCRRPRRVDWYVFLAAVTPFALSVLVSAFDTKIFHARYFLFAHLFVLAAVARLVCRIPTGFPRAAVAAWLVANGLVIPIWFYGKMDFANRPGARAAAAFVEQHRRAGEPVIVCSPLYFFSLIYHAGGRDSWYCFDEGGDGIIHYEGRAIIVDGEVITNAELERLTSRRVWVVDMAEGGWGYCFVPAPPDWQLVRTRVFREAYGVQGTMLVREYERKP